MKQKRKWQTPADGDVEMPPQSREGEIIINVIENALKSKIYNIQKI